MRIRRHISPLYLSFPLILIAALALARYSYRTAERLSVSGEESLKTAIRVLGDQTANRVDNFIIDLDRELFNLVDLEHLQDFARRWQEIIRLSHAVEAAIVLDGDLRIVKGGYVSKRRKPEADTFLGLFQERLLPLLPLKEIRPGLHRHLHQNIDGEDYLISYIRRYEAEHDRTYYIILKINLDYLKRTYFPELLNPIRGQVLLSVVDENDSVLYGEAITGVGKFLYEARFPTTLYLWRLQIAPLESWRLRAGAHRRQVSDTLLIGMMLGVIIIGSGFLLYAISTEHRANELKSEFISNVSHELKTPLSLIRMFGELLMLGKVKTPEKGREYAEIITRESERLSRLIDNVLDFSRMERGKAAYDMKPGDLGEVVERALDFYRYRLEREGRQLEVDLAPDLPVTLLDENAMTLLLLNLVDNALKYGGDGPITVRVRPHRRGSELHLSVIDRGPGIPRDEHKKIFERFYRARSVRKKNVRGSGIGLALVRHISAAHGGQVEVQSAPGQGATFTVILPVRAAPVEPSEAGETGETGELALVQAKQEGHG